jgi:hypothetical protein
VNYRKNVQKPARLLSFLTRFLRTIAGLFRKPRTRPPAPTVPRIPPGGYRGYDRDNGGFGNPLSPRSKLGRWWIPPDARAEPLALAPMKHRNESRRLRQRVAKIA